jgi:hypothetical protein
VKKSKIDIIFLNFFTTVHRPKDRRRS